MQFEPREKWTLGICAIGGATVLLSMVVGLTSVCYDLRWYNMQKDWRKQYNSPWKKPLDCAISAGILGFVLAIGPVCVFLFVALRPADKTRTIVLQAILWTVCAGVCVAEAIPQKLLTESLKYCTDSLDDLVALKRNVGTIGRLPEKMTLYADDPDYRDWIDSYDAEQLSGTEIMFEDMGLLRWVPEFLVPASYVWTDDGYVLKGSRVLSCIFRQIRRIDPYNCIFQFNISKCLGSWSEDDLVSRLEDRCERSHEYQADYELYGTKKKRDVDDMDKIIFKRARKGSSAASFYSLYAMNELLFGLTILLVVLFFGCAGITTIFARVAPLLEDTLHNSS